MKRMGGARKLVYWRAWDVEKEKRKERKKRVFKE